MKINTSIKNILEINLERKTASVKMRTDLREFWGGVGLSMKLYSELRDEKPLIFSIGPLSGFFPYLSKTSVFFGIKDRVFDYYIGGSLSSRMRFSNLDAIVFLGRSKSDLFIDIQGHEVLFLDYDIDFDSQGLPGRRSFLKFDTNKYLLDNYFRFTGNEAEAMLSYKRVMGVVISSLNNFSIEDFEEYDHQFKSLLLKHNLLTVEKNSYLSCTGCPMGCSKSQIGEKSGNLFCHSLVACSYADKIFTDSSLVISLLRLLGYDYKHEDLERYLQTLQNLKNEFKFE